MPNHNLRTWASAACLVGAAASGLAAVASSPAVRPTLAAPSPSHVEVVLPPTSVDPSGLYLELRHWPRHTVTFRVRGDVAPEMAGWWRNATRWAEQVTGLELVEVSSGPADITVIPLIEHNGGWTRWPEAPRGELRNVTVELGCCREEVAWHELVHALGVGGHSVGGLMDAARAGGLPPGPEVVQVLTTIYGTHN